ncbi:MAG: aminotransferase class I/II-fold pyridoxal phosphate-dependent enzyme [Solirubrobacteraceae bacterium]|nr:aminotransferase class I/II-fold pyridoxal phosphate-dependent enzyme [Solirubrobacteraceae bacterium]
MPGTPRNPVLDALGTYPFVRLTQAKTAALARGAHLIDFGVGEPREETPAFIRAELIRAVEAERVSTYPAADGLPELREAIAGWIRRRFGATIDPATEVVPTLGSKEAVFSLASVLVDRAGGKDLVATTTPGYPVPARGGAFAGAEVVELELTAERDWLPDLDEIDWSRLALLWLNYPNNPTAATVPLAFLEEAAARCREHGAVLASDEAYSELWFEGDPPTSALELPDRTNVLVLNTLSKRSSMPGYRSGFVAGDPQLIAALKRYRPSIGTAPQTFVQRAAALAWQDEAHVAQTRDRYRAKRDVLLPALRRAGLTPAGGDATFFLWLAVPDGDDAAFSTALLDELDLVVAPGSYLGDAGAGYVRAALVPTLESCQEAARRLDTRSAKLGP